MSSNKKCPLKSGKLLCRTKTTKSFDEILGLNKPLLRKAQSYKKQPHTNKVLSNLYRPNLKADKYAATMAEQKGICKGNKLYSGPNLDYMNIIDTDLRNDDLISNIGVKHIKHKILQYKRNIILHRFLIIQARYFYQLFLSIYLDGFDIGKVVSHEDYGLFQVLIERLKNINISEIEQDFRIVFFLQKKYFDIAKNI